MPLLVLTLLGAATVTDLRRREIPDWIPACLALAAIVSASASRALAPAASLPWGALMGIGAGVALFAVGAMGGGDVKLLAALGLACGAPLMASTLFYTALTGGVVGAAALIAGRREIPYAPAIGSGFLVATWRAGLW